MRVSHVTPTLALTLALTLPLLTGRPPVARVRKAIKVHPGRKAPRAVPVRSVRLGLPALQGRGVKKGRQVRPAQASEWSDRTAFRGVRCNARTMKF